MEYVYVCWALIKPYLVPIAILISGIIAFFAMRSNRKINKQRASTDFLFSTMENERYWKAIGTIRKLHHDPNVDMKRYALASHKDTLQAKEIRYVLNYFEHFAIGIKNEIYDDHVIKQHLYTIVQSVLEMLNEFIKEVTSETGRECSFSEIKSLGKRWSKKPLKEKKTSLVNNYFYRN